MPVASPTQSRQPQDNDLALCAQEISKLIELLQCIPNPPVFQQPLLHKSLYQSSQSSLSKEIPKYFHHIIQMFFSQCIVATDPECIVHNRLTPPYVRYFPIRQICKGRLLSQASTKY